MENEINQIKDERKLSNLNVSVILSFYNEEKTIPVLIERLETVFQKEIEKGNVRDYELLFINDDSSDQSVNIILGNRIRNPRIKLINLSRRFGSSPSLKCGLDLVRGDLVVTMESCLKDPPELIHELIAAYLENPFVEVVNTQRIKREGETLLRRFITRIGYSILQLFSNVHIRYNSGIYKMITRRVVNELVKINEVYPFYVGLVEWIGFKSVTVQYVRHPRKFGKSKFPILGRRVIRNFIFSALMSFTDAPLIIMSVLGAFISFCSMSYMGYLLIMKLFGADFSGFAAIMSAIISLSGTIILSIGIIGLYISTIFYEVKKRPLYVVDQKFGFDDQFIN